MPEVQPELGVTKTTANQVQKQEPQRKALSPLISGLFVLACGGGFLAVITPVVSTLAVRISMISTNQINASTALGWITGVGALIGVFATPMTSFNHLALGSITDWMHRIIAGIEPAEPGYRRIRFAPRPGGTVSYASGRHRTPFGDACISWQQEETIFTLQIEVPVGAEADVHLPSGKVHHVGAGRHRFSDA